MTTAPPADQRRLLDLQALDTQIAKVAHERRSHPSLAALAELEARAADLGQAEVMAASALRDVQRELTKAEDDVAQVRARAERDQKRLDAGEFGAKDAVAVIAELEALAKRTSDLEEIELEVMERAEAAERDLAAIKELKTQLEADVAATTAERDAALADFDAHSAELEKKRAVAADGIDAALLGLYEKIRTQNSGLAVLGLRGSTTEPVRLELSLSEVSAFKSAAADEVLRHEEQGYILVRLDD